MEQELVPVRPMAEELVPEQVLATEPATAPVHVPAMTPGTWVPRHLGT